MRWLSRQKKLADQVNLIFVLLLFTPVVCMTLLLILFHSAKVKQDSLDDINHHARVASYIYLNEKRELQHLAQEYSQKKVVTFLLGLDVGEKIGSALAYAARFHDIDMITVIDRSGTVLARSHNPEKIKDTIPFKKFIASVSGSALSGIEILTAGELSREGIDIRSLPFEGGASIATITGFCPIYDEDRKEALGVIILRRILDNQSKLLETIGGLEKLTVGLFVNSHLVSARKVMDPFVYPSKRLLGPPDRELPDSDISDGTIMQCIPIEGITEQDSAVLMIQKSYSEYLYSRNTKIAELILTSLVILIFGFFIRTSMARQILLPVKKLKENSDHLAEGRPIESIAIESSNELGQLTAAFNHMAEKLQTAEKELKESETKYRSIFENAVEGIFQTSPDGRFISVNSSMATIFGFASPEEMISSITDISEQCYANPEEKIEIDTLLQENSRISGVEIQYRRKDGTRFWGSESVRIVRDPHGRRLYHEGTLLDITERKAREEAQRERDAAELANRTKSEFLANMSHEIRTPLNSILGFTDVVAADVQDPRHHQYLTIVQSAGRSLLMLINDILDLSKIEAGKMVLTDRPTNIRTVLRDLQQIFSQSICRKKLEFILEVAPDLPERVMLDENRLRQILFNLVGNAVKFTEKGYIRLRVRSARPLNGGNAAEQDTVSLIFSVEDSGIGIPEQELDSIFLSFHQARRIDEAAYPGTGLGLAICKRLAEEMNGSIEVISRPDEGSAFRVTLNTVRIASDPVTARSGSSLGDDADGFPVPEDDQASVEASKRGEILEDSEPLSGSNPSFLLIKGSHMEVHDTEMIGVELPEPLQVIFQMELLPIYQSIRKALVFTDVRTFGKRIEELGHEYGVTSLVRFSRQLITATDMFDVQSINRLLDLLSDLLDKPSDKTRQND